MFVPIVLTTVLTNKKKNYLIFVDIPAIFDFFSKLVLPSNVILRKYPAYVSPYKFVSWRKEVRRSLKDINIQSLTFYHTEFGEVANWLVSQYRGKIPIYSQSPFKKFPYRKVGGFQAFKMRLIYKLFFNTDINVLDMGKKLIPSISDSFYKKNCVICQDPVVDNKLVSDYVCSQYGVKSDGNHNVVIVTGGAIKMGYINELDWNSLLEKIVNRIGKDRIVVKCHPRFDDLCEIEKSLEQVQSCIPGNVLIPLFECYIGVLSTMLNDAANEGKTAISLLNLLDIEEKQRELFKLALTNKEKNGKVMFPNTIDELVDIVSSSLIRKENV